MIEVRRSENDRRFEPGDILRHFKHETDKSRYIYRVIGIAKHTESEEELLIYQDVRSEQIYARPLEMAMSEVDKNKYPNIKQKYRLEKINWEEM